MDLRAYLGEAEAGEAVPEAAGDAAGASIGDAAAAIRELLADRSMYFSEIAESVPGVGFQFVARAMGELHAAGEIDQDAGGRYRLASERL